MSGNVIIDAHSHVGEPDCFFVPEAGPEQLLARMDKVGIAAAVCCDRISLAAGCGDGLEKHRKMFESSGGRIHYLGVFAPQRSDACIAALERANDWPGFVGLKIHPSFHGVPAEDPSYEPAWRFAAGNDLPIMTHSWSVSGYNPVQYLSTPGRFEGYVRNFPGVRLVLAHVGGRGGGRREAVRMANEYPNIYLDIAGDIFDHLLIESLVESVPVHKTLFGSDCPWLDHRSRLSHVLLADISTSDKARILCENARRVYNRMVTHPDQLSTQKETTSS